MLRQGAALALGLVLALAGCDRPLNGAIDLFHDMEGGPVTQLRPPPPGVNDPYPYIGSTPARPLAPDVAAEQRIGDTLAAQRDAAAADAARDPIKTIPPVAPPPKPVPADPNANRVTVDAAPSPAPAPAPRPAPQPTPSASTGLDSIPAPTAALDSGPLPDFAAAPPPIPEGLGVVAPPPPPSAPQIVVKPPAPLANGILVAFTPGSSTLPPSATLTLRRFVMAHRASGFAVVGHGDGGPRDPDSQSRAMELGLRRAASIATSLSSAGVPASKIQLRADAIGIGSSATLN